MIKIGDREIGAHRAPSATEPEIAWLAGLLEGEGYFFIRKNNRGLGIRLYMTDKDVVERAARMLGASVRIDRRPSLKKHWKTPYVTGIYNYKAIRIMQAILPYMGERRSIKIKTIISLWDSIKRRREVGLSPLCHPDRPHEGRGLCKSCYRKTPEYRAKARVRDNRRYRAKKLAKSKRKATSGASTQLQLL